MEQVRFYFNIIRRWRNTVSKLVAVTLIYVALAWNFSAHEIWQHSHTQAETGHHHLHGSFLERIYDQLSDIGSVTALQVYHALKHELLAIDAVVDNFLGIKHSHKQSDHHRTSKLEHHNHHRYQQHEDISVHHHNRVAGNGNHLPDKQADKRSDKKSAKESGKDKSKSHKHKGKIVFHLVVQKYQVARIFAKSQQVVINYIKSAPTVDTIQTRSRAPPFLS